jgi:hypothetical protein
MGASVPDQALVASDGAATHLHPTGFDPSRWRCGDILLGAGDVWRVGTPPADRQELVLVERLFRSSDPIMDVPCGHAFPPDNDIWFGFERLLTGPERYAIAMEARQGTDPTGLDGEAATARASSEASPGKDNHA